MDRKRLEWRVGLFVFVGLAVLGVLLVQFSKGMSMFQSTYAINLAAKNVGGLKSRAAVLMSGVQVGTVSDIRLAQDGKSVIIGLRIFKEIRIYKDARFVIETAGFLGDQYVAVVPTANEGAVFAANDTAFAQEPLSLQEVARSAQGFLQRIDETAQKLNEAIADVRRQLLNDRTLTNLAATVTTMRAASERALTTVDSLNALVASNGPSIALAVSNVVYFSDQINRFGDAFGSVLTTNSTEINKAVKNIQSSTEILKGLANDLQAGRGLAGTLLRDQTLATNVQLIAENLAITTSNLNRHGLWAVLWAKKPPKTETPKK